MRSLLVPKKVHFPLDVLRNQRYDMINTQKDVKMAVQTRDQSPEAILERIETMMRELAELRQMVLRTQSEPVAGDLAQQLYGALGHGSWEEYDLQLDWKRFSA
jgi:hypothetical protein